MTMVLETETRVGETGATFAERLLDELVIEDEGSFRHVGMYHDLKDVLRQARYRFRVLPEASAGRWDRALLLNLTFWRADDGGDLLVDETIPADVVTHVAWHHLAATALTLVPGAAPSVPALFMGEAIASAFDLYLVGRLMGHAPESSFLATQVPAMAETAEAAGLDHAAFSALVEGVVAAPERAFHDLRELLFDAATALFASATAGDGFAALSRLDGHRFAPLLHRYELSNWVLYARAHARPNPEADARAHALDATLRAQPSALDWLAGTWLGESQGRR